MLNAHAQATTAGASPVCWSRSARSRTTGAPALDVRSTRSGIEGYRGGRDGDRRGPAGIGAFFAQLANVVEHRASDRATIPPASAYSGRSARVRSGRRSNGAGMPSILRLRLPSPISRSCRRSFRTSRHRRLGRISTLISSGCESRTSRTGSGVLRYELTDIGMNVSDAIHNPRADHVYWLEMRQGERRDTTLHSAPLHLGEYLRAASLLPARFACPDQRDDDHRRQTPASFVTALASTTPMRFMLSSPFDYESNAMILIPTDLPGAEPARVRSGRASRRFIARRWRPGSHAGAFSHRSRR